jgi:hypothetical protein
MCVLFICCINWLASGGSMFFRTNIVEFFLHF